MLHRIILAVAAIGAAALTGFLWVFWWPLGIAALVISVALVGTYCIVTAPGGGFGAAISSCIRRTATIFGIAVVMAAAVLLFAPRYPERIVDRGFDLVAAFERKLGTPENQVSVAVGSPSVQTRERLINDRFEQVAWADLLLKSTMTVTAPGLHMPGAAPGSVATDSNGEATHPAAAADQPKPQDTPTKDASKEAAAEFSGSAMLRRQIEQYGGEQAAWFDRMLGFRDRLRLERADAMLDDRHDMDNNTLYNLSFDAAVVPLSGVHGYAVVEVTLTDDPAELQLHLSPEIEGVRYALRRFTTLRRQDVFEIYFDWLGRTQQLVKDNLIDADLSLADQTQANLELADRLRRDLCESLMVTQGHDFNVSRDACRRALGERLVPHTLPQMDNESAEARQVMQDIVAFEREAEDGLRTLFNNRYQTTLVQKLPELREHVAALQKRAASAIELSESEHTVLEGAASNPLGIVPDYDEASILCRLIYLPSERPQGGAGATVDDQPFPIVKLQRIYEALHIQSDPPPPPGPSANLPVTPASTGAPITPAQGAAGGAASQDTLRRVTIPCPPQVYPRHQLLVLETMERLVDGLKSTSPVKQLPKLQQVREMQRVPGEFGLLFRASSNEADDASPKMLSAITSRPCLSVMQIADLLRSGRAGVYPGRDTRNYGQFFEIDRRSDDKGSCSLTIFPRVVSPAGGTNILSGTPVQFKWAKAQDDCHPEDPATWPELVVAENQLEFEGLSDVLGTDGYYPFPAGYAPIRIGSGYYPVIAVNAAKNLLRLGFCVAPNDRKQDHFYRRGEVDVLGRLAVELAGPAYTGDTPVPTTEAFPYGLTPRTAQSYKLQGTERNSLSATIYGQKGEVGSEDSVSQDVTEREVVGFIPHHWHQSTGRSADFGWLIAPEAASQGSRSLALKAIPLGALVAVPSWWRTVLLRICAASVTERDLPTLVKGKFWDNDDRIKQHCRVETLRLPGTAQDLSRRLGIEILSTPFVRQLTFSAAGGRKKVLQAGMPANLLLEGGRLWRSTVVTLGGQRADQIVVLPDLRGIIAEFKCVEAPHEPFVDRSAVAAQSGAYAPFWELAGLHENVPVQVWTSEGQTDPLTVDVWVRDGFKGCNASPQPATNAAERTARE